MALLGAIQYDPAASVSASIATPAKVMAAFDTTNARLTFTTPANGIVLARLQTTMHGGVGRWLLGILEASTVVARMAPMGHFQQAAVATMMISQEAVFCIPGVSAGSHTYDAAFGVEVVQTGTGLKYGGPNDTTADNAFGALIFELWEATNCLGAKLYDPAAAVTKSTTALLALTALDTTNLRITFTAPSTGKVLWRIKTGFHGSATYGQVLLGVLESTTVRARIAPVTASGMGSVATSVISYHAQGVISGLTPGNSYTFDAAYGVETIATAGGLKYGGPNDTTADNAFGATTFEIWST